MITWNEKSSDDYGVIFETVPTQPHAARKMEVVSIPGRSGDLLIPQNAWENYEQPYDIFAGEDDNTAPPAFLDVASWLYEPSGYAVLEDSFYPGYFRVAHFDGPFDVDFELTRVGRTRISFNCKPQWYLKSGNTPVTKTAKSSTISNPTQFDAKPLLRVVGRGNIIVNGTTVTISSNEFEYIDIDCESMTAYSGSTNANGYITQAFPVLSPGSNTIKLGANITSLTITPRWYTI